MSLLHEEDTLLAAVDNTDQKGLTYKLKQPSSFIEDHKVKAAKKGPSEKAKPYTEEKQIKLGVIVLSDEELYIISSMKIDQKHSHTHVAAETSLFHPSKKYSYVFFYLPVPVHPVFRICSRHSGFFRQ